jgi:hypothetical protein
MTFQEIAALAEELAEAVRTNGGTTPDGGGYTPEGEAFQKFLRSKEGKRWLAAREEGEKLQAREDARHMVRQDRPSLPDPLDWDDLHGTADPAYFIDELWPDGGRVLLAGAAKAGKSTLLSSLVGSLANGEPFLDRFAVRGKHSVFILDAELASQLKKYYLGSFPRTADVKLLPLRGCMGSADLLDPAILDALAEQVGGYDVLIVDPLGPFLAAAGVDENDNTGVRKVLMALDELMRRAGVKHLLVAHHFGHGTERSRGASVLMDWPDAMWRLSLSRAGDLTSTRCFGAFGRDVEMHDTELTVGALGLELGSMTKAAARARAESDPVDAAIMQFVGANPGSSKNAIEKHVGGRASLVRSRLQYLVQSGRLSLKEGSQAHRYSVPVVEVDEQAVFDALDE